MIAIYFLMTAAMSAVIPPADPPKSTKFSFISNCKSKGLCGFEKTNASKNVGCANKDACNPAKSFSTWE